MRTPVIHISDSARRAFLDAAVNAGGDSLRLEMSPSFVANPFFGPVEIDDIAVDCDGLTILLDPSSAGRVDGVSIDYLKRPDGSGFKFENPNKPQGPLERKEQGPLERKEIELTRDCEATIIPGGQKLNLSKGRRVIVTQALGGSFTVTTEVGQLVRIAPGDADALGLEIAQVTDVPVESGPFDLQKVIKMLKTVFDPEIPVNVVDLGLVYACDAQPLPEGGHKVEIKMSMTAPGCGMGDVLKEDARAKVQTVPGVVQVDVEIVWDPPWDQSRMSEAARLHLGWL